MSCMLTQHMSCLRTQQMSGLQATHVLPVDKLRRPRRGYLRKDGRLPRVPSGSPCPHPNAAKVRECSSKMLPKSRIGSYTGTLGPKLGPGPFWAQYCVVLVWMAPRGAGQFGKLPRHCPTHASRALLCLESRRKESQHADPSRRLSVVAQLRRRDQHLGQTDHRDLPLRCTS